MFALIKYIVIIKCLHKSITLLIFNIVFTCFNTQLLILLFFEVFGSLLNCGNICDCFGICCMFHCDSLFRFKHMIFHPHTVFVCICVHCFTTKLFFVLCVHTDERFPEYGKVEFVFSYGPEKIKGNPPY